MWSMKFSELNQMIKVERVGSDLTIEYDAFVKWEVFFTRDESQ